MAEDAKPRPTPCPVEQHTQDGRSTVEFFGATFCLDDTVPEIALMEFAEAASEGVDGDTMAGMAAMLRLVKGCVAKEDLGRFLVVARKNRATTILLLPVVQATMAGKTERPTGRPSDSSDGPVIIEQKSESSSADKGSEMLHGRPDLQLAVMKTRNNAA